MYTDKNNNADEQPLFPLFNFDALKNLKDQPLSSHIISPGSISGLNDVGFLKKPQTFDKNIDIIINKRGRKPKKEPIKDINSKDITIKEIIEDQQSGIPTVDEVIFSSAIFINITFFRLKRKRRKLKK